MFSKILNRQVNVGNAASIAIEDARDVVSEITTNLQKVKAKLAIISRQAYKNKNYQCNSKEWEKLTNAKADMAALHQLLLRRISDENRAEKERKALARENGQTIEQHFLQIVKHEANRVDFQRWILQAEMRHNATLQRKDF